jgi:hypothetical protein
LPTYIVRELSCRLLPGRGIGFAEQNPTE